MKFNYNKLRGKIIEKYGSQREFVTAFGISQNSFSQKMNNKIKFTTDDIMKIVDMLDIEAADISEYFFTEKV